MKHKIKKRIFEILKNKSENGFNHGIIIAFSDIEGIFSRGAHPIGTNKKEFREICSVFSTQAEKFIKRFKEDGALLIDKKGNLYLPPVYLNVNVLGVDEDQIHPEFGARHIAALATSQSTKSCVYALSEETNKVREFIKGKVSREYPEVKFDIDPTEVEKEIIKQDLKKQIISTTYFKDFVVHKILRFPKK